MILHIVRHAEAIERSDQIAEAHRYLTRRGRKRFRRIAESFRGTGFHPEVILTSPLVRAVQTADILSETLSFTGDLLLADLLAGFDPESLDRLLDDYPHADEVALVGHEPDLGRLAQMLLATDAVCTLKKGSIISFKMSPADRGHADFIQLVTGGGRVVTARKKALERLQEESF